MTDSAHDWLPERHLGVAATLSHADELIGQVGDLLFDYQSQPDGIISVKEVLDPYEKFVVWKKKSLRDRPPSLRAGSELVRRIDGLQPFHRQSDPTAHPLARLVLYTNHAKHRKPAITAVRLAAMYRDDDRPRSPRDVPQRPEEPLREGEVIAETPIGTRIPVTLFPTVGINRPRTDRWPVLMKELDEISYWVRAQAVPRLITGAEPPAPALPTRYEIAVGHEEERSAISAGSTTSAADRQKERMSAAAVRVDLVGLIGRIEGSPDELKIQVWLGQLSNAEVLARMYRIRPTHDFDPDVILQNVQVLESLGDESAAFARAGRHADGLH